MPLTRSSQSSHLAIHQKHSQTSTAERHGLIDPGSVHVRSAFRFIACTSSQHALKCGCTSVRPTVLALQSSSHAKPTTFMQARVTGIAAHQLLAAPLPSVRKASFLFDQHHAKVDAMARTHSPVALSTPMLNRRCRGMHNLCSLEELQFESPAAAGLLRWLPWLSCCDSNTRTSQKQLACELQAMPIAAIFAPSCKLLQCWQGAKATSLSLPPSALKHAVPRHWQRQPHMKAPWRA